MMVVWIAMLVMAVATLAVHLGLPEAISVVVSKVSQCHKCMSFWSTFIVLSCLGADIVTAALLSVIAAYLSTWAAVLLIVINHLYERLWQRVNQPRNRKRSK